MVDRRGHPASHGTICRHFHCEVADPPCIYPMRKRVVLVDQRPAANLYGYYPTWRYHRHREKRASLLAIEILGRIADGRPRGTAPTSRAILITCERGCASLSLGCSPISSSIENGGTMFHITNTNGGSSQEHPLSNWHDMPFIEEMQQIASIADRCRATALTNRGDTTHASEMQSRT